MQCPKKMTDKDRITILENAIREVNRRSALLIHQNTGRWDMTKEHDRRTHGVVQSNINILKNALK